jgi:hypothetical protein
MAIREERDFLSENERQFLFDCLHDAPHVRADGRELMQQRKVRPAPSAHGLAPCDRRG